MKKLDLSIKILRISLGIIFLWFGLLKFSPYNPVFEILSRSFSFMASGIGLKFLAILETAIGVGLILNLFPRVNHSLLIFHLLGTFLVFILGPEIMFDPSFPFLTLEGEFVLKNLVLVTSGLVVLEHSKKSNV